MIFQRLIWAALATAVVVGSVQTGVQRWQAVPLILAAEVYEEQKAEAPKPAAPPAVRRRPRACRRRAPHDHGTAKEWEPGRRRRAHGWTWVANVLHAFSMALLVFAVMGVWLYRAAARWRSLRWPPGGGGRLAELSLLAFAGPARGSPGHGSRPLQAAPGLVGAGGRPARHWLAPWPALHAPGAGRWWRPCWRCPLWWARPTAGRCPGRFRP
jgi:hypothetical protein